jgi:hypothetical protein
MKSNLITASLITAFVFVGVNVFAQQSAELPKGYTDRLLPDAQIGMVMCDGEDGKLSPCSGALEETVLGIVTNVPYVTLNKPSSQGESKFIFNALVSDENGSIVRGDYLKAGKDGKLVKTEDSTSAYAVALESADGSRLMKVKVIKK